ncbi:MAG: hypothetical protein ACJZ46_00650 [Candidatus Thalassarchaeaceae archaeon]
MDFDVQLEGINIEDNTLENTKIIKQEKDEALGDFFDPFEDTNDSSPGIIQKDGKIKNAPERDIVTEISIEGERSVNWSIMVAMIFIYSIISIQIGNTFDPLLATIILIFLAGFGFTLGEVWIPKEKMKMLGITWVIISMKVLYGLAIEFRNWNFISVEGLVLLLIFLVFINLYFAYRHNHDAIAAQSTLVLLSIGSTTGSVLGEEGVAGMIFISTIMIHSLAIHRKSGNLASLGIAASNLWVGMHAITSGFQIGELVILQLESPLLLFLLLMSITGLNASMAAKFAREENWFSNAFKISGLGKPGLWGVSISLGMVGAFLSIAANRQDLGYALGMVTFLCTAFGGSYLRVRGVETNRIIKPIILFLPFLAIILLLGSQITNNLLFDEYDIFTIFGSILTGYILLRDQNSVSDRVLWIGSVLVLIILVSLVPTKGDGGSLLLILLSLLHIGTAALALKRDSPALAGVTVLSPWVWMILEKITEETMNTLFIVKNSSNWNNSLELEVYALASYLSISLILMAIVNIKLGKNNVNLASKFLGLTEISATIRDSEILQLWSIGLWLPMISIIIICQLGGFNSLTLLFVLTLLIMIHIISEILDHRIGEINNLLIIIAISIGILQWEHGLDEFFIIIMLISVLPALYRDVNDHIHTGMSLMSIPLLIFIFRRNVSNGLISNGHLPNLEISWIALICTTILIVLYLRKSETIEKILKSTLAALFLIISVIGLTWQTDPVFPKYLSIILFVFMSIWLVARGELKAELKTINLKQQRIELANIQRTKNTKDIGSENDKIIKQYDPLVASLKERRKINREMKEAENLEQLYISDVNHRPIIIMTMLSIVFIFASINALISGPNALILLMIGLFASILVAIAKYRTKSLKINLLHILGIEIPIAMAICGVVIVHNISHIGPLSSNTEMFDLAILAVIIMELVIISVLYQDNLIDRIPVAIDWFLIPLLINRIVGTLMNESLPFPFTVNPFNETMNKDSFLQWEFAWILLEFLLIMALICDFWIVNKRNVRYKENDIKSNRGVRNLAIVMISFGPAGILAAISTIRQGFVSKQTTTTGMGILSIILAMYAFGAWSNSILQNVPYLTLILGTILLIALSMTSKFGKERWSMALTIDSHILIIGGLITTGYFTEIYFTVLMVLVSTITWIIGIIQLRKIFRIWGLIDLILAMLFSLIFVKEIFDQINILIALTLIAIELGIIGWLGISNEKELIKD